MYIITHAPSPYHSIKVQDEWDGEGVVLWLFLIIYLNCKTFEIRKCIQNVNPGG